MRVWYPGIGYREAWPLSKVEKEWAEKAREVLEPFRERRDTPMEIEVILGQERADALEQRICEALVAAYQKGFDEGGAIARDLIDQPSDPYAGRTP